MTAHSITNKEAERRFGLRRYLGGHAPTRTDPRTESLLYEKSAVIHGDLRLDPVDLKDKSGIIVNGHLTLQGDLVNRAADYGAYLLVLGDLKARNIRSIPWIRSRSTLRAITL